MELRIQEKEGDWNPGVVRGTRSPDTYTIPPQGVQGNTQHLCKETIKLAQKDP